MAVKVLFCLICTANLCLAQLPAVCTNPWNFYERICCPEPFRGAGPCGSWLAIPRGSCVRVSINETTTDVRGNWPHYYEKICKCQPRFGNYDCGECAYGFSGIMCDRKIIRTRKLLNHMSKTNLNGLVDTLYMAKSFPSRYVVIVNETRPGVVPPMKVASVYDVFVWIHYYISKETYVYDFGHGGPGFLVWHRHLLMWLERELRWMLGGDISFAVPFWDWSSEKHRMYPFHKEIFGVPDENGNLVGNFANWSIICNGSDDTGIICDPTKETMHLYRFRTQKVFAGNYSRWPRREEICDAVSIPIYDSPPYDTNVDADISFRIFIEGFYVGNETCNSDLFTCVTSTNRLQLHNEVHNMLNGTMTNVPLASNDPIFILHHAFVDYILEMWIRRHHGDFKPPPSDLSAAKGHNFNNVIVPFLPLVRVHEMLVESTEFGWTYESLDGLDLDSFSCHSYELYNDSSVLYPMHESSQESLPIPYHASPQGSIEDSVMDRIEHFGTSRLRRLNYYAISNTQYSRSPLYSFCFFVLGDFSVFEALPYNCYPFFVQSNYVLPRNHINTPGYKCFVKVTSVDQAMFFSKFNDAIDSYFYYPIHYLVCTDW